MISPSSVLLSLLIYAFEFEQGRHSCRFATSTQYLIFLGEAGGSDLRERFDRPISKHSLSRTRITGHLNPSSKPYPRGNPAFGYFFLVSISSWNFRNGETGRFPPHRETPIIHAGSNSAWGCPSRMLIEKGSNQQPCRWYEVGLPDRWSSFPRSLLFLVPSGYRNFCACFEKEKSAIMAPWHLFEFVTPHLTGDCSYLLCLYPSYAFLASI
jgi:hypothetical protein